MPKGLKQTSSTVAVGFSLTESAANTFTETSIDLNLSPLDREVFVVLAVNLDSGAPDAITAVDTKVHGQLTSTSQADAVSIANANCMATRIARIQAAGFVDGGVGFVEQALETPPATLEYIGIIATSDFFVGIKGTNNLAAKGLSGKLYGYRAIANADVYAALVQSEVLSA